MPNLSIPSARIGAACESASSIFANSGMTPAKFMPSSVSATSFVMNAACFFASASIASRLPSRIATLMISPAASRICPMAIACGLAMAMPKSAAIFADSPHAGVGAT